MALLLLRTVASTGNGGTYGRRLVGTIASIVLAAAYVSTLFAHDYKPHTLWLENNFPALLVILLAVVALYLSTPIATDGEQRSMEPAGGR